MKYWEYCCLFENVISAPSHITIDGELQKFDEDEYGFIKRIYNSANLLIFKVPSIAKEINYHHDIVHVYDDNTNQLIGYSITIITLNSGKEEKFYSLNNTVEALIELGDSGWEVTATDMYYYGKDYNEHDIEKRYLLLDKLGLSIAEGFIEEIQLTRTKYLMKREKNMSDSTMKAMERMRKR
ncbi:MAG: hypothetical protein VKL60_05275 [Sphaerospermopsis sp.]|nr:hypothetical protein [Sphaerospermopsis sp.]